jgi:hypothetical protein
VIDGVVELSLMMSYISVAYCCRSIVSCIIFSPRRPQCEWAFDVIDFSIEDFGMLLARRSSYNTFLVAWLGKSMGIDMLMKISLLFVNALRGRLLGVGLWDGWDVVSSVLMLSSVML